MLLLLQNTDRQLRGWKMSQTYCWSFDSKQLLSQGAWAGRDGEKKVIDLDQSYMQQKGLCEFIQKNISCIPWESSTGFVDTFADE